MSDASLLLFVRIPHAPEPEEAWNRWYDQTHLQARLELPGITAAHRFRGVSGEFEYLTFYEMAEPTALSDEAYRALRQREAQSGPDSFEALTNGTDGLARGVYASIHGGDSSFYLGEVSTLFSVGHDVPADRVDEFNAWYDTEHVPAMLERVPGFMSGCRYQLVDAERVPMEGTRTTTPQFISLYGLRDLSVLESAEFQKEKESPWSSWVRSWYTKQFRVPAERVF